MIWGRSYFIGYLSPRQARVAHYVREVEAAA